MLIDVHAHIYPENLAQKVTANLNGHYGVPIAHQGTVAEYLNICRQGNVDAAIVFTVATKPEQVSPANRWAIINNNKNNLISFGTLHPDYQDLDGEINRLKSAGIKGIKLHPDFQKFYLDDKKAILMYEKLAKDFIILFHVGDDQVPEKTNYTSPARLANVLDAIPSLKVIAAHMGGYQMWDQAIEYLVGKNLYFDTSSSYYFLQAEKFRFIIKEHGWDKILLGSDYPFSDPIREVTGIKKLALSDNEYRAIIGDNARKLLADLGL
ncbi:amidohydrolase family protein [Peptococcaceae bacterium 1198_IL3148]